MKESEKSSPEAEKQLVTQPLPCFHRDYANHSKGSRVQKAKLPPAVEVQREVVISVLRDAES